MTAVQSEVVRSPEARRTTSPWWWLVLAGGILGIVGAVWQTAERMSTLEAGGGRPICEINSVVSCQTAYGFWQSSALGIPNSLVGLPVFAIMTSGAVAALLGSRLSTRYVASLWGLAVFMTVFVLWYMEQSAFEMRALCLFCTASMVNILLVAAGLTRAANAQGALGAGVVGAGVRTLVARQVDLLVWIGLAAAVAVVLYAELA